MNTLYPGLEQDLKNIIDRSRMHEESFLPDSKGAAGSIIKFLHDGNYLKSKVVKIEVPKEINY
jgi:hypothetical protein